MDRIVAPVYERIRTVLTSNTYVAGLAAASVVGIPVSYFFYNRYMCWQMRQKMDARAQRTRNNILELKKDLEENTDFIDANLVKLSFRELQEKLQSGELSATQVLRSYQAKAMEVNDKLNAVTDVLKEAGLVAKQLDALDSSKRGPLHGIPISVKECLRIKGHDCTLGFGGRIDILMRSDNPLVQVMKSKGAIPFIRTSAPQGLRSISCDNPIYGVTYNPYDQSRAPGGSSSGDGSMLASEGSIFGLATDMGGSLRIPACYCGTYCLKPTAGRLSYNSKGLGTQNLIKPTEGPMARDVYSLVKFMDAVLCKELFDLDAHVPPIPFRTEVFESKRPLKIGFYIHDGCTKTVPAIERGIRMATAVMERLGHTVIEIEPIDTLYVNKELFLPITLSDQSIQEAVKFDNHTKGKYDILELRQEPYYKRWLTTKFKELLSHDPARLESWRWKPVRTVQDWFQITLKTKEFILKFTKNWLSMGLDAIICPAMPSPAPSLDKSSYLTTTGINVILYSVLNYPAGVVPVTKVTKADVAKTQDPRFYDAQTEMEKCIRDDATGTEGLPVGIQIVGLPYNEELVLRVMSELENSLKRAKQNEAPS